MSLLTTLPLQPSVSRILRARKGLHIDCSKEHRCLRAASRFEAGEVVLVLEGLLSDTPSRYSVQVGADLHVQPSPGIPEDSVRAAWRYLNHSCNPNAAFRGPVLTALVAIEVGAEITFDYNTTEATMAEPFTCRCGHCGGRRVGGYRALSRRERSSLKGWIAPYLLDSPAS
jgi:SET domain